MWYNQAADPDQHSFSLLDPDTDQHYGMRIRIQEKKNPKKSMEIIEKKREKKLKMGAETKLSVLSVTANSF